MGAGKWLLPDHAFHLADAENGLSIQRQGLHSAEVLIERSGLSKDAAQAFRGYRSRSMLLPSGELIRDQRPMPPSTLARCLLDGLSPQAWYRLVNSKVFFWLDVSRLKRHMAACAKRPQILLVVDSRRLLARYGRAAFITPFNVGNAMRRPALRSERSFVPFDAFQVTRWETEAAPGQPRRRPHHPPAEIAVEGSVPDVMEMALEVVPVDSGRLQTARLSPLIAL